MVWKLSIILCIWVALAAGSVAAQSPSFSTDGSPRNASFYQPGAPNSGIITPGSGGVGGGAVGPQVLTRDPYISESLPPGFRGPEAGGVGPGGSALGGPGSIGQPSNGQVMSSHLDLDSYLGPSMMWGDEWTWQLMPTNLIYKSYLAGVKESRLASQHINIKEDGWLWDAVLGGRVGLLRFGNQDPIRPDGFQLDFEGSAQVRLDVTNDVDVRSVDFRGGIPLTFGAGPWRTKFGYYHLSSHLGDEFLIAHPGYPRLNYSRDCLVLGETVFLTDRLRVYGEVAWAFYNDINKPWEFQFGVDYSPVAPTGFAGEPFFALNGHLRQELNYSGHFVAEAGWAWVSDENTRLLRIGFFYFNGLSNQYSFYNQWEQQIGAGIWYDY